MNDNSRESPWTTYESPLGTLTLTATGRGLRAVQFPGRASALAESDRRPEAFPAALAQLEEYFAGTRQVFDLQLDLGSGTGFQRDVWRHVQAIPYGTTVSYGESARRLGRPGRVRAIGAAIGRNPLPIVVACHRVVGADGRLTGYGGGLQRKRALLDAEAIVAAGGRTPVEFGPRQLVLL